MAIFWEDNLHLHPAGRVADIGFPQLLVPQKAVLHPPLDIELVHVVALP